MHLSVLIFFSISQKKRLLFFRANLRFFRCLSVVIFAAVYGPQACATCSPTSTLTLIHTHTHTQIPSVTVVIALLPETAVRLDVAAGASVQRWCEDLLEVSWL